MSNHVILNNIQHKNTKVITRCSAELGDAVMYSHVYPYEYRHVQADYPIVFAKNEQEDSFFSLALFGLEQKENLYLSEQGARIAYVPLMMQRGPFLIGYQDAQNEASFEKKMVISIDMDNPRVNHQEGETLFLPHGGHSDYTESIISILQALHDGQSIQKKFIDTLVEHDLLESFDLDITFDNNESQKLSGFYTINEQHLAELDDKAISELNRSGVLQGIYMVIASLSNFDKLIRRKNKSLSV